MKTRNVDWPLSLCGYGGPPFVAIQFFPRYLRLVWITCFLLRFSLCLFPSAFQVFSVISLCIYAHFFNCLVKLFTELIGCLMFQNASFVNLFEFPLSPTRALCLLSSCVGLDAAWEFGWIIFPQKCHWYCFYTTLNRVFRISLLSCFSWSFQSIFLHGCDVYTMRHHMENIQLLPLIRFSFCDVSETTSNYTGFLIHRVLHTSFSSLLNFFWVMMEFTVNLPTASTLLLMLFSNVFEFYCFKLLVL